MAEFNCKRCGKCCGLAPFSKPDYRAVFKTAKRMGITFVKTDLFNAIFYLPRSTAKILETNPPEKILSGDVAVICPFLGRDKDEKAFCRIYGKRPEVCRLFGVNTEKRRYLQCPHQEEAK